MNKINKQQKTPGMKNYVNSFVFPLSLFLALNFTSVDAKGVEKYKANLTEILNAKPDISLEDLLNSMGDIDKDKVAEEYLKQNLFVNGKPITDEALNYQFEKLSEDKYQITYTHTFEWIPNFSDASSKKITIDVSFSYKDNNIYIQFDEIKIWRNSLQDNWILGIDNTVYDYDINQKSGKNTQNKSIEINTKVNRYKTLEMIKNRIKEYNFSFLWDIEKIDEFENTQLTQLNNISLWEEVLNEWEFYYREVFLIEKWKYRPMAKIYFDKYWVLDQNKSIEELKNRKNVVLGVTLVFEQFNVQNKNVTLSLADTSKNQLKSTVKDHREWLMNIIDKAKVGPHTQFKWFNKRHEDRVWGDSEKVRLFDTKLISLELIDDTYVFRRWNNDQVLYFGVESNDAGEYTIYLKNKNNQKVESYFETIDNDYYQITLKNNQLTIYKIKKEEVNIKDNLPSFYWDKTLVGILSQKNLNTYYNKENDDKSSLEYWTNDWTLVTSIPCEKTEDGHYKLEKASTNINIEDLYNHSNFTSTVNSIQKIQKELNILDIDLLNGFHVLLDKEWVKLENQDLIKVVDQKWIVNYCTIKQACALRQTEGWMQVNLDEKLYKDVEKVLKKLQSRLEIVKKLNDTKVRWMNKWEKQDFTKFVWWGWWIWTRFISQNNIISFITQATNQIELDILRWEWQMTTVIYDMSVKSFKAKLKWKPIIVLAWQKYKRKIDNDWHIVLYPVEIRSN